MTHDIQSEFTYLETPNVPIKHQSLREVRLDVDREKSKRYQTLLKNQDWLVTWLLGILVMAYQKYTIIILSVLNSVVLK